MKIKVLLFGIAREIAGNSMVEIELKEKSVVKDLMTALKYTYPDMERLKSLLIAVNSEYAEDQTIIHPNDEIAIIPPVSGG